MKITKYENGQTVIDAEGATNAEIIKDTEALASCDNVAEMNIPIYRALKLDTEDEWVEGYFGSIGTSVYTEEMFDAAWIYADDLSFVDPATLAIHFPNSNTSSEEKRWYTMNEISNIIKEHEDDYLP